MLAFRGVRTDPIDLPWSSDRREQHALQFFVQYSAPELAGYFDSPFWQRMVLQAGRSESAVRHAMAAIGALHEKLITVAASPDQSQERRTQFALEQCNMSIQHLMKPPDAQTKPNLRLMLTTCVLFTCFETLQGHTERAVLHATQGYSLLQQYATVSLIYFVFDAAFTRAKRSVYPLTWKLSRIPTTIDLKWVGLLSSLTNCWYLPDRAWMVESD